MKVLGVTGLAQHGKDTFGQVAVEAGYTRYAFADQLKELALHVNPVIYVQFREAPANEVYDMRLAKLVEEHGWEGAKQFAEVRRFLQELGTGVRNIIGEEAWVEALFNRMLADGVAVADLGGVHFLDPVVITDVRFHNEAAFVHAADGALVLVRRDRFDNGIGEEHDSERFVRELPADYVVRNNTTLEDFIVNARDFLAGVTA